MNKLLKALGLFTFAVCAAETQLQRFEFSEPHMATTYRIVLYAAGEDEAKGAARAAFDEVERLNGMLSDYDEDSELSKLSARSGGPAVAVSPELFEIIAKSIDASHKTGGAFDITVGPVVDLWKRAQRRKELPDPEKLAAAQALVGISNVLIDEKARTVELKKKGMRLDLGGIAKGYAVDRAQRILKERGITRALVVGGGDIGVSEAPPGESGWKIDIRPLNKGDATPAVLLLKNAGVSTSGDAEQHLDTGGKRYSHIVDPKTGKAMEGRRSFTVVAPDATTSDSLTKACALDVEGALEAIDKIPGVAALYAIERERRRPLPDGVQSEYCVQQFESKMWKDVPKVPIASKP